MTDIPEYASILQRREGQVYVHYIDQDKRLDEWVDETDCKAVDKDMEKNVPTSRKRKRRMLESSRPSLCDIQLAPDRELSAEDLDIKQHKQITAQRNFETVHFGNYQIKTWYVCSCPLLTFPTS